VVPACIDVESAIYHGYCVHEYFIGVDLNISILYVGNVEYYLILRNQGFNEAETTRYNAKYKHFNSYKLGLHIGITEVVMWDNIIIAVEIGKNGEIKN
jgi:hypothetical protein